jgi:hypothetical protein
MTTGHTITRRRFADALAVLRGRPPRFDYGLLLVLPFVAAAGGVLISLFIENAVERRRANGDRGFIQPGRGAPPDTGPS